MSRTSPTYDAAATAMVENENSEEHLALILESLAVITYACDFDEVCACTYISPNVTPITGFSHQAHLNTLGFWRDHMHPDDLRRVLANLEHIEKNGHIESEYRWKTASGEYIWFYDVTRLRINDDGYRYLVGTVLDITERKNNAACVKKQQLALNRVSRLSTIGEIATTIAHELNQPLTAIKNYTTGCILQLENQHFDREELLKTMRLTCLQTERASEIVQSVRNFISKGDPVATQLCANKVIQEAIRLLDSELHHANVQVNTLFSEDLPTILADHTQLQQVLVNLIKNAIEAMADNQTVKKRIDLITGYGRNYVKIMVKDNGPGLLEHDPEKIFQQFFTTKPSGMGIGLAICRTIIEKNGGTIRYKAVANEGANFEILLPIYKGEKP